MFISESLVGVLPRRLGEARVGEPRVQVRVEQDVCRLDVAVHLWTCLGHLVDASWTGQARTTSRRTIRGLVDVGVCK